MTTQILSLSKILLPLILLFATTTTTLAEFAMPPGPPGPTNVTKILEKAGQFTTLLHLLDITKVGSQINTQLNNSDQGMTVFAPSDNAFSSLSAGTLNSLSDQQKDELVQFHVIPTYISASQFQTLSNPLRTQAGDSTFYKFPLNITTSGNSVNLTTGVVNATVANLVYTDGSLAVYQVDKVLLPMSLFGPIPPAEAPAPEPEKKKRKPVDISDAPAAVEDNKSSGVRRGLHGFMGGLMIAFFGILIL
ncbi:fasciclin-like arabinogalactan protein 12 [Rutidosis leptorrhynchoides]|uniref:fasciclin-like arabinogalactan protein 12 n=1 Tax=Rutidosis leptorrhynchoides TaxID=125765 RepID=UPI003A98EF7C